MPKPRSASPGAGRTAAWAAIIQILLKLLKAFLSSRSKTGPAPAEKPLPTTRSPAGSPSRSPSTKPGAGVRTSAPAAGAGSRISELFRAQLSDQIVTSEGVVVKVLRDDTDTSDGSGEHQQFLVEVDNGAVTIRIAHNLKFGRVPVDEGDSIRFKGEYEYNDLGGCVHWTHHDPKNWREGGWIEHRGRRYE